MPRWLSIQEPAKQKRMSAYVSFSQSRLRALSLRAIEYHLMRIVSVFISPDKGRRGKQEQPVLAGWTAHSSVMVM